MTKNAVLYTAQGCARHCKSLSSPTAWKAFEELSAKYFFVQKLEETASRPVLTIGNVRCYVDNNQVAWINAEDVARGLGFVDVHNFATSGEKVSATGGRKTYSSVRWARVNDYLAEYNYPPVKVGDYLPENIFYRLAMKANNQTAQNFQAKIADEILPALRREDKRKLFSALPAKLLPEPVIASPQILMIGNVRCYVDKDNTAWLNLEDVAYGLGFVTTVNGKEYVRWNTVNNYLQSFGFLQEVAKGGYISENIFYRLAMKASNQTAQNFQAKIADEILPTLRKTGSYSIKPAQETLPVVEKACVYVLYFANATSKIGVTNDIVDRARAIERSCGFKVVRVHNSDFIDRELALQVEKTLHAKFNAQRLEGEFFAVTFAEACRELERCLAEMHLFEPLTLPDVNLADKLLAVADKLEPSPERQRVLLHAANLIVGQELF